jgi:hypothetical protein
MTDFVSIVSTHPLIVIINILNVEIVWVEKAV